MKYFGVIGNRDHIKIGGEKRPFHEFLDVQPDGWLTSLVYAKGFHRPPNTGPMIFDCGAWSYRTQDEPQITVEGTIGRYQSLCQPGDICVAPDHILLPDSDINKRVKFNDKAARDFIDKLPNHLTPMVVVHGLDRADRALSARRFVESGYRYVGVGGVAARASSSRYCVGVVEEVRNAVPDVHLHVMGLSSPNYFAEWVRLGVDSCDGSSHFKQAFTGGAFFGLDWTGKLVKHQAARRDSGEVAPDVCCDCGVCVTMRAQGVDTRAYGSNESNMGRAVHNMNMLMLAQCARVFGVHYLVSCVSKKASLPSRAQDLYISAWFKKARRLAESNGSRWHILSAKHGLLGPAEIILPYEQTLENNDSGWAELVAGDIVSEHRGEAVFILAGRRYRRQLTPLLHAARVPAYAPLAGRGIGRQMAAMTPAPTQQSLAFDGSC